MYILAIVAVVIIMYARTLSYGYCIDDFQVAKDSVGKPVSKSFWVMAYRAWQGIQYKDPFLGHVITFVLQLINSVLIYLVFGQNQISFLVALLFTLHPAATQTSVWLSGKAYSTAILCVLLMYWMKWLSPVFYYLAFAYGGFSAILAPALFISTNYWWLVFLIPFGFLIHFKRIRSVLTNKWNITPTLTKKASIGRLLIYFKTLGYYTRMMLFPLRLGVYHNYLYTYGLSEEETKRWSKWDIYAVLGVAVFVLTGYCFFYFRTSPVTFGLVWYLVLISQWCNFPVTLQQAIGERYLSLPLIGGMLALVNGIFLIPDPAARAALLAMFLTWFGVRLQIQIPSYRNIHFQIDHNLVNYPECYALWTWKGQEEKNRGAFFTAIEAWFQGWKLRKNDFRLNNNIAVLLTQVGQLDQALDFLKIAEANIPKDQMKVGMEYINQARAEIMAIKNPRKSNLIIPGGRG